MIIRLSKQFAINFLTIDLTTPLYPVLINKRPKTLI